MPTALKIRVRIPLTTKFFSLLYEKVKINEKEAGVGPLKINFLFDNRYIEIIGVLLAYSTIGLSDEDSL